jgi:hypothetical protein
MAPMTALGFGAGGLGIILGLGNHMDAAITVSRMVGTVLGPLLAAKLLLDSFRWRLRPMIGLGAALGAVLVFGATVQPWYLLWAAIPLASAAGNTKFRMAATVISAAFAVALPPTGNTFDGRRRGHRGGDRVVRGAQARADQAARREDSRTGCFRGLTRSVLLPPGVSPLLHADAIALRT